ncbi:hypothetical protein GWI33_008407 [Rhynchophorus ferrugineus]|uniref:Kinesin-like protein n=1 Tax=Rhynchophorus ferrugineus TaxID=354439 RepID=A0A834MFY9_RHYFE|nr:hypothetical protein GWI33_008407 [Rhynchophorus ferrugineus]
MSNSNSVKSQNVKVFIRLQPSNEEPKILTLKGDSCLLITKLQAEDIKRFKFNGVFPEYASQTDIYKEVASPIVERTLRGYNGTVFAYGQSGTGKTFTMIGNPASINLKGIIPNVFTHLFTQIALETKNISHTITVTFLEIYNEHITDLLNHSKRKLEIREKPELGLYVKDLTGYTVESIDQVVKIINKGNKNRSIGLTKLNDQSSRSHAIFTVLVETKLEDGSVTVGKMNLVDLAGSERVSKTFASGHRLKEAGKINLSLSVLGNVISALIDGKTNYIPYRNSKLTRLLQDSLGGNCLTSMIATVSSKKQDYEETLYTLMYADRVRYITNQVTKNDKNTSLLKTFENKIKELQSELNYLNNKPITHRMKTRIKPSSSNFQYINEEKASLLEKIETIQKKILVGGENLLEKAELQMELFQNREKELEMLNNSERLLSEKFQCKTEEKRMVQRRSLSLQEEDQLLDQQIADVERKLLNAQNIMFKKEMEYQNEIGYLLYTNKNFARHMGLLNFVMKKYIPHECMQKILNNISWNEQTQEWKLNFIAHSGNNIKRIKKKRKHT